MTCLYRLCWLLKTHLFAKDSGALQLLLLKCHTILLTCLLCIFNLSQFQTHQQAGDLPWLSGIVDECDMDIDIDLTAEVQCAVFSFFVGKTLNIGPVLNRQMLSCSKYGHK